MRTAIVTLMILTIAGAAMATDLGNTRDLTIKDSTVPYEVPADPKQGGDNIFSAFVIPGIPFNDTGTTAGYLDDYDEVCPYTGVSAPDVVYSLTPATDVTAVVDLCGSSYDTKLYIYDSNLVLVACNDDFYFDDGCGVYVSKIEGAALMGGETYFIIVDGYGTAFGDYVLSVTEFAECPLECPADAVAEGEGHLVDGYADSHNGGCNSPEFGNPFQYINWINVEDGNPLDGYAWLCGVSGWYVGASGGDTRDTDWFSVTALQTGVMEFTVESAYPVYMFTLTPTDCASVGVDLQATADCNMPATLAFPVTAGVEYWLWVGPTTYVGPVNEFTYFMTVSNNMYDVVPVEQESFGGVKALYR